MAKDKIVVGLEIGTRKIVAVVGEISAENGTMNVIGVGRMASCGVRKGEIVDFANAARCVRDALLQAEDNTGVGVGSVILSISGGHIGSQVIKGVRHLEDGVVNPEDLLLVEQAAHDSASFPPGETPIALLPKALRIDGNTETLDPVGLMANSLEGEYHVITANEMRMGNSSRVLDSIEIMVDAMTFGGLASMQVVMDDEQRAAGGLAVDIGGGTMDYVAYCHGWIGASGCIPVAGDHITNDISMGFKIPMHTAERLKLEHGSAFVGDGKRGEIIRLNADESTLSGKPIERDILLEIINARVSEMFQVLKVRLDKAGVIPYLGSGVVLTGGTSLLPGIDKVAEEILGVSVRTWSPPGTRPSQSFEDPTLSTGIGLVKWSTMIQTPTDDGVVEKVWKRVKGLFGR
jgi:cell division protein FtsA